MSSGGRGLAWSMAPQNRCGVEHSSLGRWKSWVRIPAAPLLHLNFLKFFGNFVIFSKPFKLQLCSQDFLRSKDSGSRVHESYCEERYVHYTSPSKARILPKIFVIPETSTAVPMVKFTAPSWHCLNLKFTFSSLLFKDVYVVEKLKIAEALIVYPSFLLIKVGTFGGEIYEGQKW